MPKLSDLEIDEVSLVRKGANQHAHVAIAKSAEGEPGGTVTYFDLEGNPVDPTGLEHGDIVLDDEGTAFQYDASEGGDEFEDGDDVEKGFGSAFRGARDLGRLAASDAKIGVGTLGRKGRGAGKRLGDATRRGAASAALGASATGGQVARGLSNGASRVGSAVGNAGNTTSNIGSNLAGFARTHTGSAATGGLGALALGGAGGYAGGRVHKSFAQEVEVELSKALTDEDRDVVLSKAFGYMDELAARADEATEIAKAEREARLDAEYLEVAKSYTLPVADEDLADALRAMAEALDPQQIETVRKCLELASDVMFAEQGAQGGGDNTDIMAQVNAASASQFAKSAGEATSVESLNAAFFEANPAAYDEIINSGYGR